MNALTSAETISPQTLEHVLGTGDISKLTVPQRVEFYRAACRSLGLNPLTRPIRFLSFQGQMQAYFTRDGTDQLRKNAKISLHVIDRQTDGDVYVVTVRARTPDGREDEDIGAVTLGRLQGDSRANALMKCITKAKRRVTLSICGLGWISEDELDTMPGARTFDAGDEPPAPPPPAPSDRDKINAEVPMTPKAEVSYPSPESTEKKRELLRRKRQWENWLVTAADSLSKAPTEEEVHAILARDSVAKAVITLDQGTKDPDQEMANFFLDIKERFDELVQRALDRVSDEQSAAEPPLSDEDAERADQEIARFGA